MPSEETATETAIRIRGLSKCYHVYARPQDRLKQTLFRGRRAFYREFWALRDVDLEVAKGESVGIVGRNGSGKSTLLQLVAGTVQPTRGKIEVEGRIGALLELGSGFDPEYTGRENVYMLGAIVGCTKREVEERFDDIAGFADIGEFLDRPVKTYSSGMVVRLAFAVQAQLQPDVLIVDEALAVGDALFQKRCFARLEELRERGVTLLFVSHDQESVRTLTNRAVLLEAGRVVEIGAPAGVLLSYRRLLHEQETRWLRDLSRKPHEAPASAAAATDSKSFGALGAVVESVEVRDAEGRPAESFRSGDAMRFVVRVRVHEELDRLHVFVRIRSKEGLKLYSWGTFNQDLAVRAGAATGDVLWDRRFAAGSTFEVELRCECRLGPNRYELQAGVAQEQEPVPGAQYMLHWRDECAFFQVESAFRERTFEGVFDLGMKARLRFEEAPDADQIESAAGKSSTHRPSGS